MNLHMPKDAFTNALSAARLIYEALANTPGETVTRADVDAMLETNGLLISDPRLSSLRDILAIRSSGDEFDFDLLEPSLIGDSQTLLQRAVKGELVIPDFAGFCEKLQDIFERTRSNTDGEVASYIPQLARVDADAFAIAVCTVDGQQFSIGSKQSYCVQSTCKPVNYAIALEALGLKTVHNHVGREPSGRSFNELTLNAAGLPHNPMINAGAIMCASLIEPDGSPADRFDSVLQTWRRLSGGREVGFDNTVFLSERDTADRNFALAYFMRENGAFPPGTDLRTTLDLYFQSCSITVNAPTMAVIAAAFANGGVCPLTNERVFSNTTVKSTLSLMASCGMYDFSGEYAFAVGLPAKSGVSGALYITVPGLCGIAIWSPRLDKLGNSVRGIEVSRLLTETFSFHAFSNVLGDDRLIDLRRAENESSIDAAVYLCAAAARGDLLELRRLLARNSNADSADYDGRTPLHLAASEGQAAAVGFLLERGADPNVVDRWGNRPVDDAERCGRLDIVALLTGSPKEIRLIEGFKDHREAAGIRR